MKRKCFESDACPVARSLEAVGDVWSLLIVREAFLGKRRFGEFQKSLGVAKNILTVRLRKLVEFAVLEQVPATDGSAYQEYTLTEKGRELYLVLIALRQWSLTCDDETEYVLCDRRDGKPVKPLAFHAHDGRELTPNEVELVPAKSAARKVLGQHQAR